MFIVIREATCNIAQTCTLGNVLPIEQVCNQYFQHFAVYTCTCTLIVHLHLTKSSLLETDHLQTQVGCWPAAWCGYANLDGGCRICESLLMPQRLAQDTTQKYSLPYNM